jgi:hypothetical protein
MKTRLAVTVVALVALEVAFFYHQHRDVVALSQPVEVLAADPAFADVASRVLAREQVSRRVVERIAEVARRRQDPAIHLAALERIATAVPLDKDVQLRLAESLRTAGRLPEAEAIYKAQLAAGGGRP